MIRSPSLSLPTPASIAGVLLVLLALAARPAAAQVVGGVVVDRATQRPLAGAPVRLVNDRGGSRMLAATDSAGRFSIRAPTAGAYWLRVEPLGYEIVLSRPFVLERGDSFAVTLETAPRVVALKGVTSPGGSRRQNRNFAGFLDRRRSGWGTRYLGPEDLLRQRAAGSVADLLMGLAPGLDAERQGAIVFRNRGRNCIPILIVDGVRYDGIPVDQVVIASQVRALEVYMQPEFAPMQLTMSPFNGCGVVAVWTTFGLGLD